MRFRSDGPEIALPSTKKRKYDTTDRMLHQPFFAKIQEQTRPFTLDACCDDHGHNALCSKYCSPSNSFLDFDCRHHHVWINPPFRHHAMFAIVRHYAKHKHMAPHTTSACLLLPEWIIHKLRPYLHTMRLLHVFPVGQPVMTVPTTPDASDRVMFSQGLPFKLHVYYDPPLPPTTPLSSPAISSKCALIAPCTIAGSKALVNIGGGLSGTMAIDTLASRNFIDASFVQQLGLKPKKHPPWLSDCVVLGDNTTRPSNGLVHVHVKIGSYSDIIWCDVFDLPPTFQIILGQTWLNNHACIPNFRDKTCTLTNNGQHHKLQCGPSAFPLASNPSSSIPSIPFPPLLSALQFKRYCRKLSPHADYMFLLALVEPSSQPLQASDPIDPALQSVLDQHPRCLSDPPPTLPPHRTISHKINLLPDSQPPFKPIYRLSLRERKEVDATIKDLLDKQLIVPSTSPFGAPILFVGKKDGTLRMCVDYRALNKLTVKNRYPLPRIDDLLDQLVGASYFTSLDLASGYHQIRIHNPDIPKTAFRTPLGHFEWKVMPFGLCNAPATFQNTMNNLFGYRIGQFVLVYMDDILIYSKSKSDHLEHLHDVLSLLEQAQFYVKPSKCHFMKREVKFLGHTISLDGLKVDPEKIDLIKNWPKPTDKAAIRSLLGFGNYFRRFIYKYSDMVLPLLELTKQNTPTIWSNDCQCAFENLKNAIVNAPVLKHPDLNQPFTLVCDASNFASGAILIQDDHPCAFASKKFSPAERNYTTKEKELLAVIQALKLFRCYLEGTHITLLTDHNPLKYFDTKQDLSPRQARWAQYLSRFDYTWQWIKGSINPADFLSRNPTFSYLCTLNNPSSVPLPSPPRRSKRKHKYSSEHTHLSPLASTSPPSPIQPPPSSSSSSPGFIDKSLIQQGYTLDPWFQKSDNTHSLRLTNGFWYKNKAIVLPNYAKLRQWAIQEAHEPPYSGHFGFHKTLQTLKRTYWWHGMTQQVRNFCHTCHSCQRNKPFTQSPAGLLRPLPVPPRPWSSISMDLIVELPKTTDGHDAIVTVVDRLTKMVHFIPCTTTVTAQQLARLFLTHIFRLHGIPQDIVSDRDPRFISGFWKEFCRLLGTRQNMSTPYHPETDGQTERLNRILEEMLRHYVAPHQDDWNTYLPACEFAINNATHDSTGFSPFFLTYGYHPLTPTSVISPSNVPAVHDLHKQLLDNLSLAKQHLHAAQARQKLYFDTKRRHVEYHEGQSVLLSTQHIGLWCHGSPKLLPRFIGPFKILKRIGELAYRLDLPPVLKIHSVFHVARLRPFKDDGRLQPPPLPLEIDGELEYEIDKIYAHRDVKVGKSTKRQYLVRWKGYGVEHDEFVPEANLGNARDKVSEYWATLEC